MTELIFSEVTECNHNMIHCRKANGTEYSIKANRKRLEDIYKTAKDLADFNLRMWNTIREEYDRRHEIVDAERFYSAEEIDEAEKNWRKYGITKAGKMRYHNESIRERRFKVSGFFDAGSWAYDNYAKYRKLAEQAKGGLTR